MHRLHQLAYMTMYAHLMASTGLMPISGDAPDCDMFALLANRLQLIGLEEISAICAATGKQRVFVRYQHIPGEDVVAAE